MNPKTAYSVIERRVWTFNVVTQTGPFNFRLNPKYALNKFFSFPLSLSLTHTHTQKSKTNKNLEQEQEQAERLNNQRLSKLVLNREKKKTYLEVDMP